MKVENGQIKNLVDPTDPQDGMTLNHATNLAASLPRTYQTGTQRANVWNYVSSATVSNGVAVFNLTHNGLSGGNAVFPAAVFKESAKFWVDDANNAYVFGGYTLASDRKTLTVTVNRLATTNANGLINLLGSLVSFVTGIVFTSAANGTVVHLSVLGN